MLRLDGTNGLRLVVYTAATPADGKKIEALLARGSSS